MNDEWDESKPTCPAGPWDCTDNAGERRGGPGETSGFRGDKYKEGRGPAVFGQGKEGISYKISLLFSSIFSCKFGRLDLSPEKAPVASTKSDQKRGEESADQGPHPLPRSERRDPLPAFTQQPPSVPIKALAERSRSQRSYVR